MDNKNRILILFHDADNDGYFSCAILVHYLLRKGLPFDNITLEPTNYTKLGRIMTSDIKEWREIYSKVFMLDVSFNQTHHMEQMYDMFENDFIWCDHHAPIINESKKLNFGKALGVRDISHATIYNVYKYLYDPINVVEEKSFPIYLRVLDAFDSWTYQDKQIYYRDSMFKIKNEDYTYVNSGATFEYNLDFDMILDIVENIMDKYLATGDIYSGYDEMVAVLQKGKICLEYDKREFGKSLLKYGDGKFTVNGRSALFIISSRASSSLLFDNVKDKYKHGIVAKRCPNGQWEVSVYHLKKEYDSEFHIGEYLKKKYSKGGGHAGAGGITFTDEEFQKVMNEKNI